MSTEEVKKPTINIGKKKDLEVQIYLDVKDAEYPTVLSLEEESVIDLKNLPETIIPIKSTWRWPSFLLSQVIESNCYVDKIIQGRIQKVFDLNSLILARIRVLLVSMDYEKIDPTFKLEFERSVEAKDLQILNDNTMRKLGDLTPASLLMSMYGKAHIKLFTEESQTVRDFLLKKLEKEIEKV